MTRTCFLPHCNNKTRASSNVKLPNKKRLSLFKPRDAENLEKWKKSIGKSHREMTLKDSVCELHFEDDNIVRFFEHKMSDGTIYKLERDYPYLKPGSVPTLFLKDFLENKKNESNPNSSDDNIDSSEQIMVDDDDDDDIDSLEPIIVDGNDIDSLEPIMVDGNNIDSLEPIMLEFEFKDLEANIDKIELPCNSWSISSISEMKENYIVVTKWNNLKPERWVVVDESLNTKVFYKDKEINSIYQKVNSILGVNNLLKIVHQYSFCSGVNDKDMKNCSEILEQSTNSCGRKKEFCDECSLIRRRKAQNLRRTSTEKRKLPYFIVQHISELNSKKEFPPVKKK